MTECERCGKPIRIAYGVLSEDKKEVLNLCWDCYQEIINQENNAKKNRQRQNQKNPAPIH